MTYGGSGPRPRPSLASTDPSDGQSCRRSAAQRRRRLAGEQVMSRRRVIDVAVRHRADDRQLVGPPRQERKVFADVDAGDDRRDGPEFAADFGRGFGLQVPRVLMGRPAPHEEQNARSGLPERAAHAAKLALRPDRARATAPASRGRTSSTRPRAARRGAVWRPSERQSWQAGEFTGRPAARGSGRTSGRYRRSN